ncbi:pyridine nucleotide-disulfide oxidoreductase family protein [Rhodotorula sp. JG-1b]|nr:pyridine nucleotide-disulfide oxidoreductase family protein [Rhodotorula sp. JG-1b]
MPPSADVHAQHGVLDTLKQAISHVEHAVLPTRTAITANTYSAADAAQAFCNSLQAAFDAKDADGIVKHFRDDGWWRDILTVDFDFNSIKRDQIKGHLSRYGIPTIQNLKVVKPNDAQFNKEAGWLQAYTSYETPEGRGKGFLRLKESAPGAGDWQAFTFFTALWEIKGHEEHAGHKRPLGAEHGLHESSENWLDRRQKQIKFEHEDPTCLIVGGGQNGLMLAARLTTLGVKTLIVEKNPRIGDSWRRRYHTLCLHDPVWADHFAYMQFPKTWPIYTPKDKLANYMEEYASQMELNVWLQSTIERDPRWDPQTKRWTVKVLREGAEDREMKVPHLVMATGFSGEPRMPTFPMDEFKGEISHSSKHPGCHGKPEWSGKKAVVVGCCNSGHDIAADFYEHGLDTTIVQRSSTYVMSSEHGIPGLLKGVYEENGPPTDDADIMLTSLPLDVLEQFHISATEDIAVKDKVILDDLQKAGFKLNKYPGGLFLKYFRDGGGYYIDVGCSRLIADGKIKIKQGVEIERLTKDGILFKDGVELKADIIILATGYTSQRETVRRVISSDVADRLGQVWGADKQGEIPGVWRYSGVPHFWLMSGNLFQARCFSKHLALQIHMIELGLRTHADDPVAYKHAADPRF